jgi:hypothetical protein
MTNFTDCKPRNHYRKSGVDLPKFTDSFQVRLYWLDWSHWLNSTRVKAMTRIHSWLHRQPRYMCWFYWVSESEIALIKHSRVKIITVARRSRGHCHHDDSSYIFQACPVWIYTQSNIISIMLYVIDFYIPMFMICNCSKFFLTISIHSLVTEKR